MLLRVREGNPTRGLRNPRTIRHGREKTANVAVNHTEITASESHTIVGTVNAPTSVAGTPTDVTDALTWTAPTGSTYAIASYNIYVDAVLEDSSTTTSYEVTGLTAETEYSFTVTAVDAGGTESAVSTALVESTEAS